MGVDLVKNEVGRVVGKTGRVCVKWTGLLNWTRIGLWVVASGFGFRLYYKCSKGIRTKCVNSENLGTFLPK